MYRLSTTGRCIIAHTKGNFEAVFTPYRALTMSLRLLPHFLLDFQLTHLYSKTLPHSTNSYHYENHQRIT